MSHVDAIGARCWPPPCRSLPSTTSSTPPSRLRPRRRPGASLGRCRWLERSNPAVACAAAVSYIEASNIPVNPTREQLTALAHELTNPCCTTTRIASFLRTWKP
ncbi:hypothetical protein GCM10010234_17970 [Streptomyces hawaiiensis]